MITSLKKRCDERIISFHNAIIYNDKNEVIAVFSSGNDITEQHQAIERLKESEETLNNIFECAQDRMLVTDIDSKKFGADT